MRHPRGSIVALVLLAALGSVQAQTAPEVWVVTRDSAEIHMIDPATNLRDPNPLDISDPDGDGTADTPAGGLCFSTVPGLAGTHAFVTYEEGLLAVIEVATGTILSSLDMAAVLSGSSCQPGLVRDVLLRGCDASVPRRFDDPAGGPVLRSYLHVAATVGSGVATAVVLDQQALIAGTSPLVDCRTLRSDGTALGVEVLENPHGDLYHRAWYTVRGDSIPEELEAVLVTAGDALPSTLTATRRETTLLPTGSSAPDVFHGVAAPFGREFPVWSQFSAGTLSNLDLGGSCTPTGNLVAVEVTGVGPHSYETWALDLVTRRLVLLDPIRCATDPVGVGTDPLGLAFLGPFHWQAAFVINEGTDDVSRVDRDKSVTPIPLGTGGGPPCTLCPIAIGVSQQALCDIEITVVEKRDVNPPNGLVDTVHIEWEPVGCAGDAEYLVECLCMDDDPACPCKCNCNLFPDDCECPGFEIGAFAEGSTAGEPDGPLPLIPKVPWPISPDDAWVPLGVTSGTSFDHLIPEGNASGVAYDLKLNDE